MQLGHLTTIVISNQPIPTGPAAPALEQRYIQVLFGSVIVSARSDSMKHALLANRAAFIMWLEQTPHLQNVILPYVMTLNYMFPETNWNSIGEFIQAHEDCGFYDQNI